MGRVASPGQDRQGPVAISRRGCDHPPREEFQDPRGRTDFRNFAGRPAAARSPDFRAPRSRRLRRFTSSTPGSHSPPNRSPATPCPAGWISSRVPPLRPRSSARSALSPNDGWNRRQVRIDARMPTHPALRRLQRRQPKGRVDVAAPSSQAPGCGNAKVRRRQNGPASGSRPPVRPLERDRVALVAVPWPCSRAHVLGCACRRFRLEPQQTLGRKDEHVAPEVFVARFPHRLRRRPSIVAHRRLRSGFHVSQPEPLPKTRDGRQRHRRPHGSRYAGDSAHSRPLHPLRRYDRRNVSGAGARADCCLLS